MSRKLHQGMYGSDIAAYQQALVAHGFMTQEEMNTGPGHFGPRTHAATEKLQAFLVEKGFLSEAKADTGRGICGPNTQEAFAHCVASTHGALSDKAVEGIEAQVKPVRAAHAAVHKGAHAPKIPLTVTGAYLEQREGTAHAGVDLRAARGDDISAIASGRVLEAGYKEDIGNHVIILHDDGYRSAYCHMNKMPKVKKGMRVEAGAIIGDAGDSGNAEGPHLHLTVRDTRGELTDPIAYIERHADAFPLHNEKFPRWAQQNPYYQMRQAGQSQLAAAPELPAKAPSSQNVLRGP